MTNIPPFTLKIVDIFSLSSGVFVIIGEIDDIKGPLTPCKVELQLDSKPIDTIELISERMPGPNTPANQRIFETKNIPNVDTKAIQAGRCILIHK